ncbi:MAG: GNAT family N-acetyltransferase [Firmicutes bacterium]|nr:GNAT family N-acetyltransferase [Bacillota bacterium]
MLKVKMESTTEYPRLVNFFIEQGLEYDEEEKDFGNVLKAWKVTQTGDYLVAGCMLVKREEHFVIQGIAVDPVLRKSGIGKVLMRKALEEARRLGAKEVILVARKPGFYRKLNFDTVPWDGAPDIFDCMDCPQRNVDCFPEVMKYNIPAEGAVL